MARCRHPLPGFRRTCLAVGALYSLMAGSILLRGPRASMGPFGVPEEALASPHYSDAIVWVYSHMLVLGVVIGAMGLYADSGRVKRVFARVMLAAHVVYSFLDLRATDTPIGTGLYHGPGALLPSVISVMVTGLFAHLAFCSETEVSERG